VPTASTPAKSVGYSWWTIDEEQRLQELSKGPRDLAHFHPEDRVSARDTLARFCEIARLNTDRTRPLVLCGFSQGGMLACDAVLADAVKVAGLALLSSSRIAIDEWQRRGPALRALPVFISHGHADADLAFSAGEALKNFHIQNGAKVTWLPFDGGHEIPLIVWRELRRFLKDLIPVQT
jgi:phospholipase/carboxylesterase